MDKAYIETADLRHEYTTLNGPVRALNQVSLQIEEGEHVVILGRNGSGKSTLAKILSCLEYPQQGRIRVCDLIPDEEETIWEIRRRCAMVFQNPDNQIIGTTVEEDIAFGPENLGIPTEKIRFRVDQCAEMVGLTESLTKAPSALSGGQKQKLAIAGVFALEPRVLILDEATSMLDPISRREFLALVTRLQREYRLTLLNITHHMDEALLADRVIVLDEGAVVRSGSPQEIFAHPEEIQRLGLDIPIHEAIALKYLVQAGQEPNRECLVDWNSALNTLIAFIDTLPESVRSTSSETESEATVVEVGDRARSPFGGGAERLPDGDKPVCSDSSPTIEGAYDKTMDTHKPIIEVEQLSYTYPSFGTRSHPALQSVSFSIYPGEILGIMGHTGSGKSTLIRHLNGLIRPQTGEVRVMGESTNQDSSVRSIRRKVGLLFQYPEHQLFADTVGQDIAYGPTKLGCPADEIPDRVRRACQLVNLDENLLTRSPFELSGGQKRRVALAGILAMEPKILVLDEPAAALDPAGREDMLRLVQNLRREGVTVVLVSHSVEDLARISDRILVLEEGEMIACDRPEVLFSKPREVLNRQHLTVPLPMRFLQALAEKRPDLGIQPAQFSIGSAVRELQRATAVPLSSPQYTGRGGEE